MSHLSAQLRIRIDDLPPIEALSEEEQAKILGAGRPRARLGIEHLETRELMAANITASLLPSGTLRIEGTDAADKIHVLQSDGTSKNVWVGSEPGATDYGKFSGSSVQRIEIFGLGGDDLIDLRGTNIAHHVKVPTTIDAGAGKDLVYGGDVLDRFPAHWDPKLRIPRGQVVAAASIVSPKY